MKSLMKFLQSDKHPDEIIKRRIHENDLNDFFMSDIPIDIYERFMNDEMRVDEIILETLNSHDKSKLIEKINEYFPKSIDHIEEFNESKKSGFYIVFNSNIDVNEYDKNERFINLINFYGYYISKTIEHTNSILVCPAYSENANGTLFDNNGICYHFTDVSNVDSILKNGLRCKTSEYREFPQRIYLYVAYRVFDKDHKLLEPIKSFLKNINKLNDDLAVLRIDLNHVGSVNVYHDDCISDKNSIYTYSNIPAKYIKLER